MGAIRRSDVNRGFFTPLVLIALIGLLVLTACQDSTDEAKTVPTTATRATADAPPVVDPTIPSDATIAPAPKATSSAAPPTPTTSPVGTQKGATVTPASTPTPSTISTVVAIRKDGDFFVELIAPESLELVVSEPELVIGGRTTPDALITVNDDIAVPDADGLFGALVLLQPGPNIIEVVGSVLSGESSGIVITVVYLP